MSVLEFYHLTRTQFPGVTEKADQEHIRQWDEIDPEFAYPWFESLAKALNNEMLEDVDVSKYMNLFEFISAQYQTGDEEVKDCIDVAFTENLFWEVPPLKGEKLLEGVAG
jgi:hypothetical protein